mgnify:CR=1 FL=1
MKIFNAFQLMSLFAAAPFLITYAKDASFYAHGVLTWVLIGGYIVGFGALTALVADNLGS